MGLGKSSFCVSRNVAAAVDVGPFLDQMSRARPTTADMRATKASRAHCSLRCEGGKMSPIFFGCVLPQRVVGLTSITTGAAFNKI